MFVCKVVLLVVWLMNILGVDYGIEVYINFGVDVVEFGECFGVCVFLGWWVLSGLCLVIRISDLVVL